MPFTPILATLGYVLSADGGRVLLVHRNRRAGDPHFGKYNGLGGKLETGEDVVACMRREIREEADLECDELVLRGTVSWPGFGKQGEDWFGFIFRVDRWRGTPRTENAEGTMLSYDVQANVGGKIAQLGSRLIDGVAKKMADQFFANFAAAVSKSDAA